MKLADTQIGRMAAWASELFLFIETLPSVEPAETLARHASPVKGRSSSRRAKG